MYSGYQALAGVYDCLNREIDYGRWSAFLEACFDRFLPARPRIVLDLACGTGRMTFPLADRGYDMIGIDGVPQKHRTHDPAVGRSGNGRAARRGDDTALPLPGYALL